MTALLLIAALLLPATVVNVVDGDTIDVQLETGVTERVRLIGIDAPEIGDPHTPVECFARDASVYASELMAGQSVSIETDPSQGDRDAFDRLLAYVWLPDGRNAGEVLLADGFARELTVGDPYAYSESFKAARDHAMTAQAGLWSPSTCNGQTSLPQPAPAPAPAPLAYAGPYDPSGVDRDCPDFRTHADAQAFFLAAGGPKLDRHRLDADHDGIACETLP